MGEDSGGPEVRDGLIAFSLPDPERQLAAVRLFQDVARPRNGPEFLRFPPSDRWLLLFPRPPALRMEYQLELVHSGGDSTLVCDPTNPLVAPGPFGDKSVIEFPGYSPPAWLDEGEVEIAVAEHSVRSRVLRSDVYVQLWASPGVAPEERVPLLVVHDGPEYARYSSLLTMLERHSSAGALPRMRAALLAPVDRNQTYSASAAYARALAHDILPALGQLAPIPHGRGMRVGMGASLGALAMLHAHRLYPAAFGALYLQSGSYFMRRHDVHESSFPRFARITRYVSRVLSADEWSHPIPVALTCGSAEENLTNNRAVESALAHQGYDVTFYENPDAHNWVAWRDAFDPSLVELLKKVWG